MSGAASWPATAVVLKYVWLREKEGWCKRRCIGAYGVVDELTPQVEVIQSDPVGFVCWVGRQSEVTSFFTCAHLISGQQLPYTTPTGQALSAEQPSSQLSLTVSKNTRPKPNHPWTPS